MLATTRTIQIIAVLTRLVDETDCPNDWLDSGLSLSGLEGQLALSAPSSSLLFSLFSFFSVSSLFFAASSFFPPTLAAAFPFFSSFLTALSPASLPSLMRTRLFVAFSFVRREDEETEDDEEDNEDDEDDEEDNEEDDFSGFSRLFASNSRAPREPTRACIPLVDFKPSFSFFFSSSCTSSLFFSFFASHADTGTRPRATLESTVDFESAPDVFVGPDFGLSLALPADDEDGLAEGGGEVDFASAPEVVFESAPEEDLASDPDVDLPREVEEDVGLSCTPVVDLGSKPEVDFALANN